MLAEVGGTVDRERRPEVEDRPRELGVDRDVPERRPPRPGLPGGHAVQPAGCVVRAEQHDGRGGIARQLPEQSPSGRGDETGIDEAGVRDEQPGDRSGDGLRGRGQTVGASQEMLDQIAELRRIRRIEGPRDRRCTDRAAGDRSRGSPADRVRAHPHGMPSARCGPGPGPLEVAAGERASAVRTGTDGGEMRADPVAVALDEQPAAPDAAGVLEAQLRRRCRRTRARGRRPDRCLRHGASVASGVGGTSSIRYAGKNRLTCHGVSAPRVSTIQAVSARSSTGVVVAAGDHQRRELQPDARPGASPRSNRAPAPGVRRRPSGRTRRRTT